MNLHRSKTTIWIIILIILATPRVWSQAHEERPNFVIIVTDDQGYGDAGYMGNPDIITPNLDHMAQTSLRMDRHYSAPVCSPTRASILTGRYPNRTGVFLWGHALRPQEQTVASMLRDNGYQTGFFGKWHLGSIRTDHPTNTGAHGFETWYAAANFYENDPWMSHNGSPVHLSGESSEVTVRLALDYIEQAKEKEAPFLVFIWMGSPHLPHESAEDLKNLYPGYSENMQNYMGEITGIDLAVGKLRNQLREWDLSGKTLVWFSSDNGGRLPEANNGDLRQQKGTLYEGGIRIPALIEWPGHIPAKPTQVVTGTVDVFPTLLELAKVNTAAIQHPIDGISLAPLFTDKMKSRPQPLGFWSYSEIKGHSMRSDQIIQDYEKFLNDSGQKDKLNDGLLNSPDREYPGMDRYPYSGEYAWIDNQWKLVQQGDRVELYNLEDDPGESEDVAGAYPERASQMKNDLQDWLRSVVRSVKGEDY